MQPFAVVLEGKKELLDAICDSTDDICERAVLIKRCERWFKGGCVMLLIDTDRETCTVAEGPRVIEDVEVVEPNRFELGAPRSIRLGLGLASK